MSVLLQQVQLKAQDWLSSQVIDQATKDRLTAEIDKLTVQMYAEKAKSAAKPPQ